jgi:alpha-tubulin suppressor-like RCC1 family protein
MKIKCGDMYMVVFDHPSQLYGWSVHRVWWKPWRYNLHFHYISETGGVDQYFHRVYGEVHRNLSLDGVKGMLKLFELWKE